MKKYILLLVFLILSSKYPSKDCCELIDYKELRIQQIKNSDFSIELLKEYLKLTDSVKHDIPLRQFILETGWFSSELFLEYNNIAGMKFPKNRETTAIDDWNSHAVYSHWTESVDDYILWRNNYISKGYDTTNYYKFLKSIGYAEDDKYEMRLKQIKIK